MKTLIKLIVAAAIVHATWKGGTAYMRYWQFKEQATEIAQFGVRRTDNELRTLVLEAAQQKEIPLDPDAINVQRRQAHIIIDASYLERVEVLPGYFYPWNAKMHVDVLTLVLQEAK
jgi:hypothetical protein